ncbi:MAG: thioesterase family protein [Acidimicrobiia bacterium]
MRATLQPGLVTSRTLIVYKEHSPRHLLPTIVLSTPFMIETIEYLCTEVVADHLESEETTVGAHVDIYHRAAAREGEEVTFTCELGMVDRRRLLFDVAVRCGERVIGEGIHERFVIDRQRFAS